jgi:predicted transcriptional regulator
MRPRKTNPRPTDAEIEILNVLWKTGPATVRRVHEEISQTKPSQYTTTLKLMQIMTDKGLVKRNEASRTHVYSALAGREQTERQLVQDLIDRAFGGRAAQLVLRALSADGTTDAELKEIRKLIDDYREKR